jgi:hypothetical protein
MAIKTYPLSTVFSIVFLFQLTMSSCSSDDPGPENITPLKSVFELAIKNGGISLPAGATEWIIASDVSGKLLDYEKLETTGKFNLAAPESFDEEKIRISFLRIVEGTDTYQYYLRSYNHIGVNSSWNFVASQMPATDPELPFKVNISHYPKTASHNISISQRGGEITSFTTQRDQEVLSLDFHLFKSSKDLIISLTQPGSEPLFYKIDSPSGETIDLDFAADFKSFDNAFNVPLPGNNSYLASIRGVDDLNDEVIEAFSGNSFVTTSGGGADNFVTLGYLDGYNYYYSLLLGTKNSTPFNQSFHYEKMGAKPTFEDFQIPDSKVAISNSSIDNFQASLLTEFQYYGITWALSLAKPGISHEFIVKNYGPADAEFVGVIELPATITEMYVDLGRIFEAEFLSGTFTKRLDGKGFGDYIGEQFGHENYTKLEKELYSYTLSK